MTEGGVGAKLREEVKQKISDKIKLKWKDPEYKEPIVKAIKSRFNDPEYKEKAIPTLKIGSKQRWSKKGERERMKKLMTKINRDKVKNPRYIQRQVESS